MPYGGQVPIVHVLPSIDDRQPALTAASNERTNAFRELFDANHADIERYCLRRAPEATAAEAVSETFLTAWRRFDDLPTGPDARLWLFGTARNVLSNLRRSESRQSRLHLRLIDEPTPPPASTAALDPSITVVGEPSPVLDALATLSADDQDVLTLIAWEGFTHTEAAAVLDCSTNAVGIRIHRARQRLADALEKATP